MNQRYSREPLHLQKLAIVHVGLIAASPECACSHARLVRPTFTPDGAWCMYVPWPETTFEIWGGLVQRCKLPHCMGSGAEPQKPTLFALKTPPKVRKNCTKNQIEAGEPQTQIKSSAYMHVQSADKSP